VKGNGDLIICFIDKDTPNKESLEKKEINISSDKKTPWKVKIFSDYISEKLGVLSIGDIIWINLSEEDVYFINKMNLI